MVCWHRNMIWFYYFKLVYYLIKHGMLTSNMVCWHWISIIKYMVCWQQTKHGMFTSIMKYWYWILSYVDINHDMVTLNFDYWIYYMLASLCLHWIAIIEYMVCWHQTKHDILTSNMIKESCVGREYYDKKIQIRCKCQPKYKWNYSNSWIV